MPAKNMTKTMTPRYLSVGLVGRIVVLVDAAIRQTNGAITAFLWMGANSAKSYAKAGKLDLRSGPDGVVA